MKKIEKLIKFKLDPILIKKARLSHIEVKKMFDKITVRRTKEL